MYHQRLAPPSTGAPSGRTRCVRAAALTSRQPAASGPCETGRAIDGCSAAPNWTPAPETAAGATPDGAAISSCASKFCHDGLICARRCRQQRRRSAVERGHATGIIDLDGRQTCEHIGTGRRRRAGLLEPVLLEGSQARSPARTRRGTPSQADDDSSLAAGASSSSPPSSAIDLGADSSSTPPSAIDLESGTRADASSAILQDPDGRQCRICFGGEEAEEELGPLFRPCSCRGTMAWVHMECLDRWRYSSSNPQSEFRCDQCKFEYRFGRVAVAYAGSVDRFTLARFLMTPFAVHILSLSALFSAIFVLGFVGKVGPDR